MHHKNHMTLWLLWTGLLLAPMVLAQEEADESKTGSQETEYNDDNYRRFMELKDQPGPTSTLPTNSYQSGTEKLDELPEASQKHLRNQLREIILKEDAWAPGDENGEYPFVASEAAGKNPALKQQEAEAWGELVGKYHEREAQIYANAARSESAAQTESGAPNAQQSQANAGEGSSGETGNEGSNTGQNGDEGQQHKPGQQGQSAESQTASRSDEGSDSTSSSAANPNDSAAESTAGVSQSALEYLQGNNQKQAAEESSTAAENESLAQQAEQHQTQTTKQDTSDFVVISKDTLSIKDLQNARGINISTGNVPPASLPAENQETTSPKNDDG